VRVGIRGTYTVLSWDYPRRRDWRLSSAAAGCPVWGGWRRGWGVASSPGLSLMLYFFWGGSDLRLLPPWLLCTYRCLYPCVVHPSAKRVCISLLPFQVSHVKCETALFKLITKRIHIYFFSTPNQWARPNNYKKRSGRSRGNNKCVEADSSRWKSVSGDLHMQKRGKMKQNTWAETETELKLLRQPGRMCNMPDC